MHDNKTISGGFIDRKVFKSVAEAFSSIEIFSWYADLSYFLYIANLKSALEVRNLGSLQKTKRHF